MSLTLIGMLLGWWFVNIEDQQGWVPATYLEAVDKQAQTKEDAPVKTPYGKSFISVSAYKAIEKDEISFEKGVVVQVVSSYSILNIFNLASLQILEQNLDGWWRARYQGSEGWVPAACLAELKGRIDNPV